MVLIYRQMCSSEHSLIWFTNGIGLSLCVELPLCRIVWISVYVQYLCMIGYWYIKMYMCGRRNKVFFIKSGLICCWWLGSKSSLLSWTVISRNTFSEQSLTSCEFHGCSHFNNKFRYIYIIYCSGRIHIVSICFGWPFCGVYFQFDTKIP